MGEYWLYDPHGEFLRPTLAGHRLAGGSYAPLPATESPEGRSIRSPVLELELRLAEERLRFFDPATARYLPDLAESWDESRTRERELDAAQARIAELERALRERPPT